ncbi:MAG: hypothetical protein ABDH59_05440 [Fervidobacterium sp.]
MKELPIGIGVRIEVKPKEIEQLNLCVKELARLAENGYESVITETGESLLNGRQVFGCSRIGKVGMETTKASKDGK